MERGFKILPRNMFEKEVMEKLRFDGEIPTKVNKPYEIMFEKVKG